MGAFCFREKMPENHKREYQEERKKKRVVVICYGDSFVAGIYIVGLWCFA
jgi:precorrin-6B methylase 1